MAITTDEERRTIAAMRNVARIVSVFAVASAACSGQPMAPAAPQSSLNECADGDQRHWDGNGQWSCVSSAMDDAAAMDAASVDAHAVAPDAQPIDAQEDYRCSSETACVLADPKPPCCVKLLAETSDAGAAAPVEPSSGDGSEDEDEPPFVCTRSLVIDAARCFRDEGTCDDFAVEQNMSTCYGVDVAVCFKAKIVLSRERQDFCFEKISTCQDLRKRMVKDQRDVRVLGKCEVKHK